MTMISHSLAIVLVAIISILGNIVQYLLNRKSNDIKNLKDRIELMDDVQDKQTKYYQTEIGYQNDRIKELQEKLDKQAEMLKANAEEIVRLQQMVNKLIGDSCHLEFCPNRSPYTTDELNEMTNKRKRNEKTSKA